LREYSVPTLVDVPATAGLADIVYRRGQHEPHAVMLRRRVGEGRWQDVTAREFLDEVTGLAKSLIAAGIQHGDRVGLMSPTMRSGPRAP
jgi:long-chain acyl-CoA synthetase